MSREEGLVLDIGLFYKLYLLLLLSGSIRRLLIDMGILKGCFLARVT